MNRPTTGSIACVSAVIGVLLTSGAVIAVTPPGKSVENPPNAVQAGAVGQVNPAIEAGGTGAAIAVQKAGLARFHARLGSDGLLPVKVSHPDYATGTLIPVEKLSLYFVRNGQTQATAEPGVGGVAQVAGLSPGLYSLIARGPDGFFSSQIQVLPTNSEEISDAMIEAVVLPVRDVTLLAKLVRQQPVGNIQSSEQLVQPTVEAATGPSRNTVKLDVSGHFRRRLVHQRAGHTEQVSGGGLTMYLVRDGRVVGESVADQHGIVELGTPKPGNYSLIATGPLGLSATGITILSADQVSRDESTSDIGGGKVPAQFVSESPTALEDFDVSASPWTDVRQYLSVPNSVGGVVNLLSNPTGTGTGAAGGAGGGGIAVAAAGGGIAGGVAAAASGGSAAAGGVAAVPPVSTGTGLEVLPQPVDNGGGGSGGSVDPLLPSNPIPGSVDPIVGSLDPLPVDGTLDGGLGGALDGTLDAQFAKGGIASPSSRR